MLVLATSGTASASTKSITDPAGDAPAALDIVRLSVDNGPKATVLTASLKSLKSQGLLAFRVSIRDGGPATLFFVRKSRSQARPSVVVRGLEDESLSRRTCPGARASWTSSRDRVVLRLPKSCLAVSKGEFPRDDFSLDSLSGLKPTFLAYLRAVDETDTIRVPRS
jgi:hypothetical protein